MTTYTRRALDEGVQFTIQTDADRWEPAPSRVPAWMGLITFIAVVAAAGAYAVILAAIAAFVVHRVLRRLLRRKPQSKGTAIVVTPTEMRWPDGAVLAASDIREVLWRDWAVGRTDGQYGVYVEVKKGAARTIEKNFEGALAHRLANEIAEILDVSASEAFATRVVPPVSPRPAPRLEDYLSQVPPPPVPASPAMQSPPVQSPMQRPWSANEPQTGDVILKQTGASVYELHRVTRNGIERWKDVPQGGLIDAVMFAHANTGDHNAWIEKLVDAGQPTLLPKLSQSNEPA